MTLRTTRALRACLCSITTFLTVSCSNADLVDVPPPSNEVDPSVTTTPASARQFYAAAVALFDRAYGGSEIFFAANFVVASGLLTDELLRVQGSEVGQLIDERTGANTQGSGSAYTAFHIARVSLSQAREALVAYAPGTAELQAHTQAL